MNPLLLTETTTALQDIPTGLAEDFSSVFTVLGNAVTWVVNTISSNWILWLSLALGILGFSISLFRRLRKRK